MSALLVAVLAVAQEPVERAVARVRFPEEEMKAWARRGDVERRVIGWIGDRKAWKAALRKIEARLGFEIAKCSVKVELYEDDGTQPAQGGGRFGRGTVRFNMRRLVAYRRELDAAEGKREGRTVRWVVPPMPFEAVLAHELSHVFCGTLEEKWVSEGLATYATADTSLMHAFVHDKRPVGTIEGVVEEADAYARGAAFFTWLEERAGRKAVHDFVRRVTRKGESTKAAASSAAGMPWSRLVLEEQAWSRDYFKKFSDSR